MKKKAIILILSASCLFACDGKTNDSSEVASSSETNSVVDNSSSEIIIKKEVTVDNIYNDLLELAENGNFTISYSSTKYEDLYTNDYVLLNTSSSYYFKGETIYKNVGVGVYAAKKTSNGYSLSYLLEGEDEEGYSNDEPLEDFHTINKFAYLKNSNYGATKDDLSLSSSEDAVVLDYSSDSSNRFLGIILSMFNNLNNFTTGLVNHVEIKYDDNNNVVFEFSNKGEDGKLTYPSSFSKGTISNIGSTSDKDAESFLASISDKVNAKTFTYYNSLSIRNTYLSTNTSESLVFEDGSTQDYGVIQQTDFNPNNIHISNSSGETFIHRSSSGAAYILGVNAQNEACDLTYYSQSFSAMEFGYKNFDFEGFRYDDTEKAYVYYGLNGGRSLNSITYLGISSMAFDSIKLYVDEESDLISKIVADTESFVVQTSIMGSKLAHYQFTIDLVDYRTIGTPSIYQVTSNTSKIQSAFNKLTDYENVSFKTVAQEWYEGKDTKALQPTVTTYYTKDYVYKETTTREKEGNTYKTYKTGRGAYAIKDTDGNIMGVKEFRVKKDGTVEPRSEILYGKTLKDYWIKLDVSPLVFDLKDNVISPREGMNGNQFKDRLPISHSRFEAQEGSMQNGGDYGGMTFTLKKDGETVTDEISEFNYTYGVAGIFEDDYSGKGVTTFTFGSDDLPITISDSILSQLETMGTFKIPTKWSESQSSEIYEALKTFYAGKKNRYGVEVDVDRDIPFLFDDDLDADWIYYNGSIKDSPRLNIYHDVDDIINDGDINGYNSKYEALLKGNSDYTYTASSSDTTFTVLYYYVNGDIVIAMTSTAAGGIYFYQEIPQY